MSYSKLKGMAFALRAERKKTKMLEEEVKRLQLVEMTVQDFLDEKIDSLEFCRNMRDMGVIE